MQWTDRIRQTKILLVVAAVLIAVASLVASNLLTRDLYEEEHKKMEIWAEAMRTLNVDDGNDGMNLVLKVIEDNTTIPVVVVDEKGEVQISRNTDEKASPAELARQWKAAGHSIRILYDDANPKEYIDVCYDDSLMLKRLAVYPYVQLGVVLLFVVIAIFALLTSKRAEQNKVWVGLSKETAHQLGTPISSLMAWTEILKEQYPDDSLLGEMEKDVRRLQLIADRFSKIGSLPEPVPSNMNEVLTRVAEYMSRRVSNKVHIQKLLPPEPVIVPLNASLFEWVIENLCKNAVDAMEGSGRITLFLGVEMDLVVVEVSDTGKGIRKKDLKSVFKPGFTTKQRGWGLGLSLAKRIVEEYHHGRIFVKASEVGRGTTFRIELKR
ncbi:MAG: HAMP domain-containing histidine kinase [Prevotella sp.]|jgi:nitrogen fixation/metabolism regulation signal transduction histidine kinase|nr:HAMP domain-containing histidine kinase [Prevotella sp.]MBR0268959.1 HAMP domain-containing histidine kinase [Prevotella sp.]MBR3011213.1 HAMP domain-containing histidine kinase [Prevotella sp.]